MNICDAGGIFTVEGDPFFPRSSFMGISIHSPYKWGRVSTPLHKPCANDVRLQHNIQPKQFNGKRVSFGL